MTTERIEHMCGGTGFVTIQRILSAEEMKGKCGLYAKVTIGPGSSLGYHEHHGESEIYFILSGQGEYNDNGTLRPIKQGDRTITVHGTGHGLANIGNEDLVFMALIIQD